jgi:NAD(P)-dependent dehydrogenase (short-subunit alcohol dehydrogenase family)
MKVPKIKNRSVLVTGCSSGIGLATAQLLRSNGWRVFATARKARDLEMLRRARFEFIRLDVTSSDSIHRAVKKVLELNDGVLGAVVNNAGFGMPGAIEDLSREAMRHQFEVNLFGLQELTNQLIPVFRKQGYGRIVNVSSVVGRMALPFMGIYSASKFALEAVSDALRVELSQDRIAVSLVEPGPIESRFSVNCAAQGEDKLDTDESRFGSAYKQYFKSRREGAKGKDRFRLPPQAVADKVFDALESPRPKIRYPVTLPAYFGDWAARFLPAAWIDRTMAAHVKKRYS